MLKIDSVWEILVAGLIIIACLALILIFLRGFLRSGGKFKAKGIEVGEERRKVKSAEAMAIDQLAPAVNALLAIQGPQTDALIAILEAQKGICNGNVDRALETTRNAKNKFDEFLADAAKVKLPREAP